MGDKEGGASGAVRAGPGGVLAGTGGCALVQGQPESGRGSCESCASCPRGLWTRAFVWKEAPSLGPASGRDFCEQAGSWFHRPNRRRGLGEAAVPGSALGDCRSCPLLSAFISLASEVDLWVILCVGPYVGSDLDLGGLPR